MITKKELAQHVRKLDLLAASMSDLGGWLQQLGQSARGTREELTERLHREIWKEKYD